MAGLRSALLLHVLLFVLAGFCGVQGSVRSGKEPDKTGGNFLEDEQWLSTISQYSRKIKHWNRFRDVSYSNLPGARFSFLSLSLENVYVSLKPTVVFGFKQWA
ncbi:testican-2 isoform X3 [Tachysurus ichikawai]